MAKKITLSNLYRLILIILIPLNIQAQSQSKSVQKLDKLLNNPDKVEKLDFQFTKQSELDY
jgi:mannitol/fructose-specific phosphotransferase system IIA component (Ntr-type)